MPLQWIERTLESLLDGPAEQLRLFPVWLLLGPRQVGKSSLFRRAMDRRLTFWSSTRGMSRPWK